MDHSMGFLISKCSEKAHLRCVLETNYSIHTFVTCLIRFFSLLSSSSFTLSLSFLLFLLIPVFIRFIHSLTEKCPTPPPAVPSPTSSAARSEDSQLNDSEIHGSQRSYDDHSFDSDTGHFGRSSFKDPETGSRTSSSSLLSPTSAFLIPFVLTSTIVSFSHLQSKNWYICLLTSPTFFSSLLSFFSFLFWPLPLSSFSCSMSLCLTFLELFSNFPHCFTICSFLRIPLRLFPSKGFHSDSELPTFGTMVSHSIIYACVVYSGRRSECLRTTSQCIRIRKNVPIHSSMFTNDHDYEFESANYTMLELITI